MNKSLYLKILRGILVFECQSLSNSRNISVAKNNNRGFVFSKFMHQVIEKLVGMIAILFFMEVVNVGG